MQAVRNRFGKLRYRFAPLDVIVGQVKDSLEICGFSYIIKTEQIDASFKAICEAHHVSGHFETTDFKVPIDPELYMNEAQKVATAQTYAKRYAFCNAFGIMTGEEDVDGNGLGDRQDQTEAAKKATAEKNRKANKSTTPEQDRENILADIAQIMKHTRFKDDHRIKAKAEIAIATTNIELEGVRAFWQKKFDELAGETSQQKTDAPQDSARQKIINRIEDILKNDKFTDKDRVGVKVEIKMVQTNIALEALRAIWQIELNKRLDDFVDDIPEELTAEQEKKIDEVAQTMFPAEEKAAQELADRKQLEEPDIF